MDFAATPIVEVKNLNSFRAVERAMKYEAQRQYEEFLSTGKKLGEVPKATAGWDEDRGITVVQRRKEEASDYRYFPEPDLVPVEVDAAWLERVRASLGELPAAQRQRLQQEYCLSDYDAGVITSQGRAFVSYFEQVAQLCGDAAETKNWLTNDVLQTLNERKLAIGAFPISARNLADLLKEVKTTGLNKQRAREVYGEMLAGGISAKDAIDKLGFKVVGDEGQLLEIVRRAVAANPKAVADYKKGKVKAADAIKGAVMRETKGMAKTELVQQLLMQELQKS
jgi:aspartyl-tRNA(Asn)/glutamyl-tRNA(Gln) amidotransferase subunit B